MQAAMKPATRRNEWRGLRLLRHVVYGNKTPNPGRVIKFFEPGAFRAAPTL